MTHARLLLFALLFTASCITPTEPDSPVRVERSWGFAGGESEQEAQQLAASIEKVLEYYTSLEGFSARPLRAHFADHLMYDKIAGIRKEPLFGGAWIAVRRDAKNVENTLAHEMAHFYFPDVHDRFPAVLEEGLCEFLADQIFPAPDTRETRLVFVGASYLDSFLIEVKDATGKRMLPYLVQPVPSIEEIFEIGWYENFSGDTRVNETLYGLGWLIAERIGWEGLVALARRGDEAGASTIPPEWILAAADLHPLTHEKLRDAIHQAFGGDGGGGLLRFSLSGGSD